MRTFVVGDIHGHAGLLRDLLPQLREAAEPGDALVFVGDYVDRGPDSQGVIEQVLELIHDGWDGPVTTLKGNHEVLMLDFLAGSPVYEPEIWLHNGGEETITSYTEEEMWTPEWADSLPRAHLDFLGGLQIWHEDENGIYVHAGIAPGKLPAESDEEELLWIREPFIHSNFAWDKVVVFGHTPQHERVLIPPWDRSKLPWRPLVRPEKIGIDTGAAYGGPLTAVLLPERRFFSARNA